MIFIKKLTLFLSVTLLVLTSSACSQDRTSAANISIGNSVHFTESERQAAIDCALDKFNSNFENCTLTKLWYDDEWSYVNNENMIILYSEFDTDSNAWQGGLNPNDHYIGWKWIIIRDDRDSPWKMKDWGY